MEGRASMNLPIVRRLGCEAPLTVKRKTIQRLVGSHGITG